MTQAAATAPAPPAPVASTAPGSRGYRYVIEAAILLLQFCMGLSFLAVAPLFPPIIEAFGIDNATVSLLVGVQSLIVAIALVPASILAARLGSKWSLVLGGVLMGLTALAPFAESFTVLLATRVSFALGAAINLSATPAVIMRWFATRELAVVNGANVVAQSLGVMTSMLVGPRIAATLGWDGALCVFGVMALGASALWLLLGRDVEGALAEAAFSVRDLGVVLCDRTVVLLATGLAGALGAFISLQSWLPTYYHEQWAYTLEEAGGMTALLSFFGILGAVLGSALPVRLPRRRPFLIAGGLGIPLFAAGAIAMDVPLLLYPSVIMLGIAGWIFMPIVFTIPMEIRGMTGARVGIAVAIVLGAGNLAGFVVPLMVGALRDASGSFVLGLAIACALSLVLVACALAMPETGPVEGRRRERATG